MKKFIYKGVIEEHFDENVEESNVVLKQDEIEIEEFKDNNTLANINV